MTFHLKSSCQHQLQLHFVTPTFDFEKLLRRVSKLLRRVSQTSDKIYDRGPSVSGAARFSVILGFPANVGLLASHLCINSHLAQLGLL